MLSQFNAFGLFAFEKYSRGFGNFSRNSFTSKFVVYLLMLTIAFCLLKEKRLLVQENKKKIWKYSNNNEKELK